MAKDVQRGRPKGQSPVKGLKITL
jgi:hypothetical protein